MRERTRTLPLQIASRRPGTGPSGDHVEAIELGEAEERRLRLMLAVEEVGFEGSQALLLEIELAAALGDGIAPGFVDLALDDERHGGSTLLPRSGVTAA